MQLNQKNRFPLQGITVIDFSTVIAAPTTGRFLADLGARVIKVENGYGDSTRYQDFGVQDSQQQIVFANANSNKQCISINTKKPAGKKAFLRLLEGADVLITNVRYRSLKKMGLSYENLKEQFPKLIYAHFSGYGYEGADAELPGYDMTAFWSRGGAMIDGLPSGTDAMFTPAYGFGDLFSSGSFTIGVLTALYAREKTGDGTFVATSLLHNGMWANSRNVIPAQESLGFQIPVPPERNDSMFYRGYRCKDGKWLMLALDPYEKFWSMCCDLFDLKEFRDDPRYSNPVDMVENGLCIPLAEKVAEMMTTRTRDEWIELLKQYDAVYAPMQCAADVSKDPQMWANHCFQNVTFPSGNTFIMPTIPLQFSEYSVKDVTAGHAVGEDTDCVLKGAGFTEDEILSMHQDGSVG